MKTRTLVALIIFTTFLLAIPATGNAAGSDMTVNLTPQATISLLTCSPGDAVWAHYGHTAIRVCDPPQRMDITFNYGIFDFNSKHFIWRFVKGQTDYILGAYNTSSFLREYKEENRRVTEQVLNLNADEKERIWDALFLNSLPENRTYRYNFFYDNCATRARKIIERNMDFPVIYDSIATYSSLRGILNHYTENHPWARFGISLLVASPADAPAPFIDQLFAPELMMEAFAGATSANKPLVEKTSYLTDINPSILQKRIPWPHPLVVFWLLFAITAFVTWHETDKKRHSWFLDGMVFGLTGLAGLIIFTMNFFSAHPAVSHNWLLLWLHPLHLVLAMALAFPSVRKSRIPVFYYALNLPFIAFATAGLLFLPQYFDPACLPILLTLLCRCLYSIPFIRKYGFSKALTCGLFLFTITIPQEAQAQHNSDRKGPALVVGIYLDQVEEDCIRWFFDGMEQNGLKKLFTEGRLYTNVSYGTCFADNSTVTANVVTGAPPLFHGIIGDSWFDPQQSVITSCVLDRSYLGNYTAATCSPQRILVSTVSDELRRSTLNHSKVYAVGINPEPAIVSGGQSANGVYWLDDESGLWCTSTYYKDMPRWIENMNSLSGDNAIPLVWTPRYALGRYQNTPHHHNSIFFSHLIKGGDKGRLYKQTPMANTRVLELAAELVRNEHLGDDEYPDMLHLHLNLGNILGRDDELSSMELEDFYFRLDEDLALFMDNVDKELGNNNVLYYVVGTGENVYPVSEGKNIRSFSPDRCEVLLNLYLCALHGDGKWVSGQTERDIYLNHTLIEEKGINYETICREAAGLVAQMEGIQQVAITQDFTVCSEPSNGNILHDSFCKGRSGDLMLTIETGRNIVWDSYPSHNRLIRHTKASTFAMFCGYGIKAQQTTSQVSIFDIAPTLCRLLFISAPTACQGNALFNSPKD